MEFKYQLQLLLSDEWHVLHMSNILLQLIKSIPYRPQFYPDNTMYIVATPTVRIVLIRTVSPESTEIL